MLVADEELSVAGVSRALGDRFDVASGPVGIGELPDVLEERKPDAVLVGSSLVSAASAISEAGGGSLVLLSPAHSAAFSEGPDEEADSEAIDLLRLAVQLACLSPLGSLPF